MSKINSGKFNGNGNSEITTMRIAAGIRSDPQYFIDGGEIPLEVIMTALVGRNGTYDTPERLMAHQMRYPALDGVILTTGNCHDSDVQYMVVKSVKANEEYWDSLIAYVDIVYPDPIEEESEVPKKKKRKKRAPKRVAVVVEDACFD